MNRSKLDITPKTKVAELLNAYPELEEKLLEFSPAFAKLKNPVLRRTVAKFTSLQQAAKVGNVNLVEMIDKLRSAAGLPALGESFATELPDNPVNAALLHDLSNRVTERLDVRPILDAGDNPKDQILHLAKNLTENGCMELLTPFPPVPIMDLLRKKGFHVTMDDTQHGVIRTFITR
jgi:hypothetical protein